MLQEPAYREHRRTRRLSSRLSPGRYSASSTPRCCGGKDLLEGKTRDSGTAQRDGAEGQRAGGGDIAGARARRAGKRTGRRNEGPQLIPADAPGTFEMVPSQPARPAQCGPVRGRTWPWQAGTCVTEAWAHSWASDLGRWGVSELLKLSCGRGQTEMQGSSEKLGKNIGASICTESVSTRTDEPAVGKAGFAEGTPGLA